MRTTTLFAIAGLAAAITPATLHAQDDASRTRQDRERDTTRQMDQQQNDRRQDSNAYGSPNEATRALGELQDLTGLWKITVTKYGPDGKEMSNEKAGQNNQAVRRNAGDHGNATRDRDSDSMRNRDNTDRAERDRDQNKSDRDNKDRGDRAQRDNNRTDRDADNRNTRRNNQDRDDNMRNTRGEVDANRSMQSTGIADRRWTLDGTLLVERYTYGGSDAGSLSDLPLQTMNTPEDEGVERMRSNRDDSSTNRGTAHNNGRKHPNADPYRVPGLVDDMSANPSRSTGDNSDANREREARRALRDAREQDGNAANPWGTDQHAGKASHGARQGMVLWGYDKSSDQVSVVWADDTGGTIKMDKGKLGSNKKLELTGESSDENGESFKTRTVIDMSETGKQTLVMYRTDGSSGKEYKALEIVYNKISSAGDAVTLAD